MAATPDAPRDDDSSPEVTALHREVSALMQRWQQAGISLHEVAMALATVGCQALGHALGDVPPPDGPEIIQHITRDLQRQAESCYFQHWWGDTSAFQAGFVLSWLVNPFPTSVWYLGRARQAPVGTATLAVPWQHSTPWELMSRRVMEKPMKVQVYTHPGWFSCRTLEEFLKSNRVQYEHHDVASDEAARAYLQSRGITALPVTIIDDDQVIIGYYPKKLIPALHLEIQVDLSGKTIWLATKYDAMLGATLRAAQQLSDAQLQQHLPWREHWTLRDLLMHVLSFPELAWLSHQHGSMSTDDMRAATARLREVMTSEAIAAYGEGVRQHILAFLQSNDTAAFDRVVPAHYGGEVTVLELLTIILSHSTHHLKQAYWFVTNELGGAIINPMTDEDLEGIVTPAALF